MNANLSNIFPDEFFDDYERNQLLRACSKEVRILCDHLYDLDIYFDDMRFFPDTPAGKLCECQFQSITGEYVSDQLPMPPEFEVFSPLWINYHIMTPEEDNAIKGCEGYYDWKKNELGVPERNLKNDAVLLHELIHVHERIVNAFPIYYHDTLYWALYTDLKKKIPELDELISEHAHMLVEQDIDRDGGAHGVLFLLKSLDLDIRMRWPLGTVFNYGYQKLLKDYSYITPDNADNLSQD